MVNYKVIPCNRSDVVAFIEKHHYSHSLNGVMVSHAFKMMDGDVIVGAMVYGKLGMANAWKKYGNSIDDVLELRRLVLIDNTPKNSESYFIGHTLRWLRRNTDIKTVVSYADPNYGHVGIIYRASNFTFIGRTSPGRVINWAGKLYHDKAIRTKYNGVLKPFAVRLKQALENGEAAYHKTEGKYIYIYKLN